MPNEWRRTLCQHCYHGYSAHGTGSIHIPQPSFSDLVASIGLSELLNCILVDAGARPAMLLQAADYGEQTTNDPTSSAKLGAIVAAFSDLRKTPCGEYSVFLSKAPIPYTDEWTGREVGVALGYPCATDWPDLMFRLEPAITYGYEILVTVRSEHLAPPTTTQLFANRATSQRHRPALEELRQVIEATLRASPLSGPFIERVELKETRQIPIQTVIQTLRAGRPLDAEEWYTVRNSLFNMDFSPALQEFEFNLDDPFHRGALATLLAYACHDPLEPFFPLQQTPLEQVQVKLQVRQLETLLLDLLRPAPSPPSPSP